MAKLYTLTFDSTDRMITVGEITKSVREIELLILKNFVDIAINHEKELTKVFELKDLKDQIQNIEDEEFIKVTKAELDSLSKAWSTTAGNRPMIWLDEMYGLLKQINSPVEYVEE